MGWFEEVDAWNQRAVEKENRDERERNEFRFKLTAGDRAQRADYSCTGAMSFMALRCTASRARSGRKRATSAIALASRPTR